MFIAIIISSLCLVVNVSGMLQKCCERGRGKELVWGGKIVILGLAANASAELELAIAVLDVIVS